MTTILPFLFLEGMKERFSQLGIVSDFEFLVGEEADYEVIRFLKYLISCSFIN